MLPAHKFNNGIPLKCFHSAFKGHWNIFQWVLKNACTPQLYHILLNMSPNSTKKEPRRHLQHVKLTWRFTWVCQVPWQRSKCQAWICWCLCAINFVVKSFSLSFTPTFNKSSLLKGQNISSTTFLSQAWIFVWRAKETWDVATQKSNTKNAKRNYSTPYSNLVSHGSTDGAGTSLSSQIRRDAELYCAYGRSWNLFELRALILPLFPIASQAFQISKDASCRLLELFLVLWVSMGSRIVEILTVCAHWIFDVFTFCYFMSPWGTILASKHIV